MPQNMKKDSIAILFDYYCYQFLKCFSILGFPHTMQTITCTLLGIPQYVIALYIGLSSQGYSRSRRVLRSLETGIRYRPLYWAFLTTVFITLFFIISHFSIKSMLFPKKSGAAYFFSSTQKC